MCSTLALSADDVGQLLDFFFAALACSFLHCTVRWRYLVLLVSFGSLSPVILFSEWFEAWMYNLWPPAYSSLPRESSTNSAYHRPERTNVQRSLHLLWQYSHLLESWLSVSQYWMSLQVALRSQMVWMCISEASDPAEDDAGVYAYCLNKVD